MKAGKYSNNIFKAIIKINLDDIDYEIYSHSSHLDFLKKNIYRLKKLQKLNLDMQKAKKEKDKIVFEDYIKSCFDTNETFENFLEILAEFEKSLNINMEQIHSLELEKKIVKKI